MVFYGLGGRRADGSPDRKRSALPTDTSNTTRYGMFRYILFRKLSLLQ